MKAPGTAKRTPFLPAKSSRMLTLVFGPSCTSTDGSESPIYIDVGHILFNQSDRLIWSRDSTTGLHSHREIFTFNKSTIHCYRIAKGMQMGCVHLDGHPQSRRSGNAPPDHEKWETIHTRTFDLTSFIACTSSSPSSLVMV